MPGPCQPCPCSRCNGALVSLCTVQRHASRVRPASIPSFTAWSRELAGTTARQPSQSSPDSDVDSMGSASSSQDNVQYSQPSKRFRSSTVRLSPCLIPCPATLVLHNPHPCMHCIFARE